MATRKNCKLVYNRGTGGYAYRCSTRRRSRSRKSFLGDIGDVGELGSSTSLRTTLSSVKGVLINGAVAAGGAFVTDKVFQKLAQEINKNKVVLKGVPLHLAEIATGLALGIVIGKLLKKPQLAAMIAIGPVVVGGLRILGEFIKLPSATSGLGMMSIDRYQDTFSDLGSMHQIGTKTPAFMLSPEGQFAGVQGGY